MQRLAWVGVGLIGFAFLIAFTASLNFADSVVITDMDVVSGTPVLGDTVYGNVTPAWDKLAGNTSTTAQFLTQTGTGTISAAPQWNTIADTDVPLTIVRTSRNLTATSPITGGGNLSADRSFGCQAASGAQAGCLSSTDWTTFNNKGNGTVTSVSGTNPIASSGGATPAISCASCVTENSATVAFQQATTISTTTGNLALNPADKLTMTRSGAKGEFFLETYFEAVDHRSILSLRSARGTLASPADVVAGDILAEVVASGYSGVGVSPAFRAVASVEFRVGTGTISATSLPAYVAFFTTPDGSVTRVERLRIDQNGTLTTLVAAPANVTAAGAGIFGGGVAFTDVANAWIDDASHGDGTTPIYIGNAQIVTVGNSFTEREALWYIQGDVAAGSKPIRIYANRDWTLKDVRCSVNTAGTTDAIIVDVNKNGTTIFTTQASRPQIAAGGFTDVSDAPDVTTGVSGDYFTVDVDQADSGNTGSDLTCQLRFRHALDTSS